VNARHSPVRRRFSYGHEYAHALFDRGETITKTRGENATQLAEKRANVFAAAFLMPTEGVTDHLHQLSKGLPSRRAQTIFDVANNAMIEAEIRTRPGSQAITYQDVASLARRFGVSYEAAVWRLKSLNHLSSAQTAVLMDQKEIGRRYSHLLGFEEVINEGEITNKSEQELRSQLVRLTVEAFRQEEISRGRLVELAKKLEVNAAELIEFAEATRVD
jgi:Zn-dependent peptidase ImmA (M78 family)